MADRVLLISGSEVGSRVRQHTAVIDAAKAAGVAQLAYTGVLGGPDADFLLAAEHKVTEQLILDSGLPYTFLRNGWYTENYTANLAPVLAHGVVAANAGDGRVASATRADYAAAAAAVLTGEGHLGKAYELSGDVAWSLTEYAAEVAKASGKEIAHNDVPAAAHQEILVGAGLPADFAAILVDVDEAIRRGLLSRHQRRPGPADRPPDDPARRDRRGSGRRPVDGRSACGSPRQGCATGPRDPVS